LAARGSAGASSSLETKSCRRKPSPVGHRGAAVENRLRTIATLVFERAEVLVEPSFFDLVTTITRASFVMTRREELRL